MKQQFNIYIVYLLLIFSINSLIFNSIGKLILLKNLYNTYVNENNYILKKEI